MVINIKDQNVQITDPRTVWQLLKSLLEQEDQIDREKEHIWVVHLDIRLKIKCLELVSLGILNTSLFHPREIYRRAIINGDAQIIIAHNHPSNNPEPSEDDLIMTQRLKKAGEIIGIKIVDHIVITETGYYSFGEHRLL